MSNSLSIPLNAQTQYTKQRSEHLAQCWGFAKQLLLHPRMRIKGLTASQCAYRYLAAWRTLYGGPCTMDDLDMWRLVLDAKLHLQGTGHWGRVIPFGTVSA